MSNLQGSTNNITWTTVPSGWQFPSSMPNPPAQQIGMTVQVHPNNEKLTQTVVVKTAGGTKLIEFEADYYGNVVEIVYPLNMPRPQADHLSLIDKRGELVGTLTWSQGVVEFIGDESESAKSLFKMLQAYIDADKEDKRGSVG